MCRLMAYIGPARLIADVVLWPDRSIIKQSYDARERLQDPSLPNHLGFGNLNGDGFGIGWYTSDELRHGDPTPCMYKSITPAWWAIAKNKHPVGQGLPWTGLLAATCSIMQVLPVVWWLWL
eukprot:GHRR01025112.1.p1 GENE.GHRR01025112.1~~GHRR01025112.1.p1  ORF type:complete len:121 (-),score=4.31 GHRR01025112.1:97-459(-)